MTETYTRPEIIVTSNHLIDKLQDIDKRRQALDQEEFALIHQALCVSSENKTKAGRLLGISRYALTRRLRRWGAK